MFLTIGLLPMGHYPNHCLRFQDVLSQNSGLHTLCWHDSLYGKSIRQKDNDVCLCLRVISVQMLSRTSVRYKRWHCGGSKRLHADLYRWTSTYQRACLCTCACVRAWVCVRVSSTHCRPSVACSHHLCGNSRSSCRRRCHGPCRASPVRRQWRRDACTRTSLSTATVETTAD